MTRPWVKICGITNRDDAVEAIRLGADALGFNLWSGSKRYLPFEENADWIAGLPGQIERVAVVVNAPLSEARRIAQHPAFHSIQFHGNEDPDYLAEFAQSGHPFTMALRLGENRSLKIEGSSSHRLLIDAAVPGEFGGTGVMLDLDLAARFVQERPESKIILAGGLTPENVRMAIERVRPFGVDVASGVEKTPRQKDWEKLEAFISAAQ